MSGFIATASSTCPWLVRKVHELVLSDGGAGWGAGGVLGVLIGVTGQ